MDAPAPAPTPAAGLDGLLWAVHFPADGPPRRLRAEERPESGWIWLHYDLVHARTREQIEEDPALPFVARTVLTSRDETPRMLADGDMVAGVLPAVSADADELIGWHFAMLPNRLVTGRRTMVHALHNALAAAESGQPVRSPSELIAGALGNFAHDVRLRVATLGEELNALEDRLVDTRAGSDLSALGPAIGAIRRAAGRLRRPLAPVARLLENDVDGLPHWIEQCAAHDAALRQALAAVDDLNAVQERGRVLQDELAARQAEETNRRLYIVSIVTTLIMPPTLVTGFFGMNTGGMFMNEWPHGTQIGLGLCVVSLVLTWFLLRWKRLI